MSLCKARSGNVRAAASETPPQDVVRTAGSRCELVKVRRALFVEGCDAFLRFCGIVEHLHGMKGQVADPADVIGVGVEGALRPRDRGRAPPRERVRPIL